MYTQQQVRANFLAALKKITTGVLRTSPEDNAYTERIIVQHFLTHQLEATEANFSAAFVALATVLPWKVKPAKLRAEEENARPAVQQSVAQATKPFTDAKKASDLADAKVKADEESIKQAKSLISAYNPCKNGRYDARERDDMQKYWNAALEIVSPKIKDGKQVAGKAVLVRNHASEDKKATIAVSGLQNFVKWLTDDIKLRYTEREKASERL